MLRYRSVSLVRSTTGGGACWLSTPRVANHLPGTKRLPRTAYSTNRESHKQNDAKDESSPPPRKKALTKGKPRGRPPAEPKQAGSDAHNESDLMTEAEYERSVWEAQKELSFSEHEWAPLMSSAPKDIKSSLSGGASDSTQISPNQQPNPLWASVQAISRESFGKKKGPGGDSDETKEISRTKGPTKRTAPERKSQSTSGKPLEVKILHPKRIEFNPVGDSDQEVPALSYGLDRVLFNQGVYQIQDARSQVFNFDPYLTTIMPVDEFDFDALKAYITSSKDTKLREMARKHGMKYCGSTSSMTAMLSQFHYLLSGWRRPNFSMLSRSLEPESENFTRLTRSPAAAYARLNDGVYAIDADKEYDKENILSMLGKSMEKLLTLPRDEFEKYRRTRSHLITEDERNADEAYHYTTLGDFLMRSQLDAYDPRLPGSGVFDLKTRAVVSIRMNIHEHEAGQGYEIKHRIGQWESFEREYYDMIRAAFLKYSLQVRMGRMDGIFIAYHNTQRIFGFQYVSLDEMDEAIHGSSDRRLGDQEFKVSVALLNDLMDRATKRFPGRSLRIHLETRDTKVPVAYFFAEPVTDEDMATSKEAAKRSVEKVQEDIMGMRALQEEAESQSKEEDEVEKDGEQPTEDAGADAPAERTADGDGSEGDAWEEVMSKVEELVEDDSQGGLDVKVVQDALQQVDLLHHMTKDETALNEFAEALSEELAAVKELRETGETAPSHPTSGETIEASTPGLETEKLPGPEGTVVDSAEDAPSEEGETRSTSRHEELRELIVKAAKRIVDTRSEMQTLDRSDEDVADSDRPGYEDTSNIETEASTFGDEQSESPPDQVSAADAEESGTPIDEQGTTAQDEPQDDLGVTSEEHLSTDEAQELSAIKDDVPTSAAAPDEALLTEPAPPARAPKRSFKPPEELMGLYVTVRSKVNGEFVNQPKDVASQFNWSVEYTVTEMTDQKAREIYPQLRNRRFQALNFENGGKDRAWMSQYRERLRGMAKAGEKYRESVEKKQQGKDVYVAWDEAPLPPEARKQGVDGPISFES